MGERQTEEMTRPPGRRVSPFHLAAFCLALVLIAGFLLLKIRWNDLYVAVIQEDAIVENGQCLAYGAAAIVALVAGWRWLKRGGRGNALGLVTLGVFLLFVSLEEISWGQRILSVRTPEWFARNSTQDEINIHNLTPVQQTIHYLYAIAGVVLSFGWIGARFVSHMRWLPASLKATIRLFAPEWYLMPFFIPLLVVYGCFLLTGHTGEMLFGLIGCPPPTVGGFLTYRDQEPTELLLALGMLLLVTAIATNLKRDSTWSQPD